MVLAMMVLSLAEARQAVNVGRWRSFTDMRTVRMLALSGDSLWAATSGGVFLYQKASGQFVKFTNSEGLSSNDVTAATLDRYGRLWVGTAEGFVNMYNPLGRVWKQIRGIAESNRVQKAIRALFVQSDSLFIGTEFGVVVYLMQREEFGDTYANFGFLLQPKVNDLFIHRNTIWVATESGVASASLASPNLSSPAAWSRYPAGTNAFSTNVTSITVFRDTVYAGSRGGVSYFQNGFFLVLPQFENKAVVSLKPSGLGQSDRLAVLWNGEAGATVETISSTVSAAQLVASNPSVEGTGLAWQSNDFWVGTKTNGVAHWNGAQWQFAVPNGPRSNLFVSLAVDRDGVLWAGSGISGRGAGFYRYDPARAEGQQWKNFFSQNYPVMDFDDYYKVSLGTGGSVWVSSWGRGVVEVVSDSIRRRISTPTLAGAVPQDPSYVVVGGVAADENGRTWFVNRTAINGFYLVRMTGETSFDYFAKTIASSEGRLTALVIDRNGTKWLANAEPQDKPSTGLAFFNENAGIVAGTQATNGWGLLTTPLLPDNNVLSLAVDLDGDVCVGTDAGVVIITDPRNPTRTQPPSYFKPLSLAGQIVQAIAVDAMNNKWVGTREGLAVLSPDGVQLLQFYNVASTNGKLLSNDIRALAIDQKRGILYIGTEKGLSSLEIPAVQTARSYTTLEFGPNPFLVPSDNPLVIQNLVSNSSVRILTVAGALVHEFPAQGGGRAFWDGRNAQGEFVPSGIYFVVAYTENGNQRTTGKIAVVRR
jgi:ligand-binding sensor domain-containing protein